MAASPRGTSRCRCLRRSSRALIWRPFMGRVTATSTTAAKRSGSRAAVSVVYLSAPTRACHGPSGEGSETLEGSSQVWIERERVCMQKARRDIERCKGMQRLGMQWSLVLVVVQVSGGRPHNNNKNKLHVSRRPANFGEPVVGVAFCHGRDADHQRRLWPCRRPSPRSKDTLKHRHVLR